MYPFLKAGTILRYDLENPVIFLKNGCLWRDEALNPDGQAILSLCNGLYSLPAITDKIKKLFPGESEEILDAHIKKFLVAGRIKGYLDFLETPREKPVNCLGNARRIFPAALVLEVTSECNLFCRHCYLGDPQLKSGFIDFSFLKSFLGQAHKMGSYQLQLTGGEPFLHPRIIDLIDYSSEIFARVVVTTNGTLIDRATAEKLSGYRNISFQVSLDGDELVHNLIRGSETAFARMISGVSYLRAAGLPFNFAATISSLNISRMEDIARTALSLKAPALQYGITIPVGRARALKPLTFSDYKFFYENSRSLAEIFKPRGLEINVYREETEFRCRLIRDLIFIDCRGEVFPCVGLGSSLGNIKKQKLAEIFSPGKTADLACLSAPDREVCGSCRQLEFCAGCHVQGLKNANGPCAYRSKARRLGLRLR